MNFVFYRIRRKILIYLYKLFLIPKFYKTYSKQLKNYHVESMENTARKLATTNKSLGRFGDGEIEWIIGDRQKYMSFEKNSKTLSTRLLNVLRNNNKGFLIGLPDAFNLNKYFTTQACLFWKIFFMRNNKKLLPLLNKNKIYYNTSVTRPYMDYNNRKISRNVFRLLRKIWNNKNILIVEGEESRVGVNDNLFNNADSINRIECPIRDAFESYNSILKETLGFLHGSNTPFIVLISLGPTATIMAYDLFKRGYRAIDIGHLDLEYTWYLIGAKEKINLPYKYVNENKNGHSALPEKNKQYYKEIVKIIK